MFCIEQQRQKDRDREIPPKWCTWLGSANSVTDGIFAGSLCYS